MVRFAKQAFVVVDLYRENIILQCFMFLFTPCGQWSDFLCLTLTYLGFKVKRGKESTFWGQTRGSGEVSWEKTPHGISSGLLVRTEDIVSKKMIEHIFGCKLLEGGD